jgi:cytochrome c oxidase cbb3-type subunit 3
MTSCISCHDRGRVTADGPAWDAYPLSYPRNGHTPQATLQALRGAPVDAMTSATPYHLHDRPPAIAGLTAVERRGEAIYQRNCAFCHAADGTAKNWIGRFMSPHPRDLTSAAAMQGMTRKRLRRVIEEGLPESSMPAWKSVLNEQEIAAVVAYVGRVFHPLEES